LIIAQQSVAIQEAAHTPLVVLRPSQLGGAVVGEGLRCALHFKPKELGAQSKQQTQQAQALPTRRHDVSWQLGLS